MLKLPILHDGDTVYFKDGQVGVFLEQCELSKYDEQDNLFFDLVQLNDTNKFLVYKSIDPADIDCFLMKNESLDLDAIARVLIKLSVKELRLDA